VTRLENMMYIRRLVLINSRSVKRTDGQTDRRAIAILRSA